MRFTSSQLYVLENIRRVKAISHYWKWRYTLDGQPVTHAVKALCNKYVLETAGSIVRMTPRGRKLFRERDK